MRHRPLVCLALAAALSGAALPATAQPRETPRALYEAGTRAYAEQRYRDALGSFQQAYERSGHPALLFNIALSWERMGEPGEAARALRRYVVAVPAAPDRASLERRIAALETEERRLHPAVPAAPAPPAAVAPAPASAPAPRRPVVAARRSPGPWIVGGLGLAAAGVGAALMVTAGGHIDTANEAQDEVARGDAIAAGEAQQTAGVVLLAGGAAALVGALVWRLAEPATAAPPVRVGAAPAPGGGLVALTWSPPWL